MRRPRKPKRRRRDRTGPVRTGVPAAVASSNGRRTVATAVPPGAVSVTSAAPESTAAPRIAPSRTIRQGAGRASWAANGSAAAVARRLRESAILARAREFAVECAAGVSATRARRVAAAVVGGLVFFLGVPAWLMLRTPGWYLVPHVPEARQQAARDKLERMADEFSMALLKPDVFEVELSQAELNDWLAMRRRIWPAAERAIPSEWSDPFIQFEPGRIVVAARYRGAIGRPIVSVELSFAMEADAILVRPAGLRIGSMPMPVRWLTRWTRGLKLREPTRDDSAGFPPARTTDSGVVLSGNVTDGFRLSTRHTWWNGARDFRVRDVRTTPGEIALEVEPLGPHPKRPRDYTPRRDEP